ncbi:single-stranded DNA-binding protein [Streptomyces hygroscopicus]|uniref:single-stranded DNA-binding protein n=1 Tax=Streptomyces hygroscopicus TaxID=1912 RepID=UPI003794B135
MAGETSLVVVGNLVDEPELRFTAQGVPVAKFRVASVPRKFVRDTSQWEDDKENALFLTCSVWRKQAENVAESLSKGARVMVQGRLKQRSYEDREGVKRTVFELDVEEVGVSLKLATAKVTKAGSGGGGREEFQQARQQHGAGDPWASGAPAGGGSWGGGAGGDEPPPF